ncbi:MAG: anti-sigma factor family protein [Acidobacteriota bacterium]
MRALFNCKECVDLLMDYLEGNLDPEIQKKLDRHFAACPPCVKFLDSYRACSEMAQQLKDQQVQIPLELENRLKAFLKEEIKKA